MKISKNFPSKIISGNKHLAATNNQPTAIIDTVRHPIILITQYHQSTDPRRQAEIDETLAINCKNKEIDYIILLNEKIFNCPAIAAAAKSRPRSFEQINIGTRLTFKMVFDFCAANIDSNVIKIAANNDISFDERDLYHLHNLDLKNDVYALSRYDLPEKKIGQTPPVRTLGFLKWLEVPRNEFLFWGKIIVMEELLIKSTVYKSC